MNTCNNCKYYYQDEQYCTNSFYKIFPPDTEACDFFKQGKFNERFYVKSEPLRISTGDYYLLIDREQELIDDDGNYLDFDYAYEAELLCSFLNKQNHRLHKLQLWVNEIYYENNIEKEYWKKHTPITD